MRTYTHIPEGVPIRADWNDQATDLLVVELGDYNAGGEVGLGLGRAQAHALRGVLDAALAEEQAT